MNPSPPTHKHTTQHEWKMLATYKVGRLLVGDFLPNGSSTSSFYTVAVIIHHDWGFSQVFNLQNLEMSLWLGILSAQSYKNLSNSDISIFSKVSRLFQWTAKTDNHSLR